MMLSGEDIEKYQEQGFVVVEDVLTPQQLQEARALISEKIEGAREISSPTDVYDLEPDHSPDRPRVRRIKTPHLHMPFIMDLARTPRLVEILQKLLNTGNVRLHGSKINMKSPSGGSPVEWHQDWAFYPHSNDDLLAVGVMLEDCTVENGAMYMIPGTQQGPVFDHHSDGVFVGAMDPADVELPKAVPCVGKAGSMSFHHVRTVHGSAQNLSHKPRTLLLYEFAAADAWPMFNVPTDLASYEARMVSGVSTLQPRLTQVPVRIPLPQPPKHSGIYEMQLSAKTRHFGRKSAA
jgi:phytanoyl-CoA hydroxylase